jgi:putative membrane protein
MRGCALLLVIFSAVSAQARTYVDYPNFWPNFWHEGWGWWQVIFGALTMILYVGAIVAVAVLIVRWLGGGALETAVPVKPKEPRGGLAQRFGSGEFDNGEVDERKRMASR